VQYVLRKGCTVCVKPRCAPVSAGAAAFIGAAMQPRIRSGVRRRRGTIVVHAILSGIPSFSTSATPDTKASSVGGDSSEPLKRTTF
jgi:hypothetical protein